MQYEILYTEIEDDGKRLIKIKDHQLEKIFLFYPQEIRYVPVPPLREYLFS